MELVNLDMEGNLITKEKIDMYFIKAPILNHLVKKYTDRNIENILKIPVTSDIENLLPIDQLLYDFVNGKEITKVKLLAASLEVFCSIEKIEGERIQDAFSNLGHMIFDMEPIVKVMEPLNIGDVVFRKEGSVKILGTLKKIKGETAYILPYGMPFDSDKLIELKHRYRNLEKLV